MRFTAILVPVTLRLKIEKKPSTVLVVTASRAYTFAG